MSRISFTALIVLVALGLGACSSTSHCRRPQDYQSAPDRAPLTGVEGMQLPESASALRIPPPIDNSVPFGEKARDGDVWNCLDMPPRLVLPEDMPKP